jgi:hypothetical protein
VKIADPIRYKLTGGEHYRVESPCGRPHFVHPATIPSPKIYVVSCGGQVLYVGSTRQRIASRFYGAFAANGETGYYGYPWRSDGRQMHLDIWILTFDSSVEIQRELETIEAEVVFCVRQRSDQWPLFQTEIHFHPSKKEHRSLAARIYDFATNETPNRV